VLLNLLSNALKFTHDGSIRLFARCVPYGVQIDVSDTGIGIAAENLTTIWEDFRQVDQSRTRQYGGTGLGLSITRRLLDRLGGSVTAASVVGEGSTFTVLLPPHAPAGDERAANGAHAT
jgi:signal transduction histidine kinase